MTAGVLARLGAARALRACARVGQGPELRGRPSVRSDGGPIVVGARFRLSSRPVPSHLAAGPEGLLEIGDDVAIGHGAAIAAFQRIRIGAGTRIGPYAVIMDTNFHGAAGDQTVRHDCRPVEIGAGCVIGSRVTITRGAVIGAGAEILAGSVVSSEIPAGACAGGVRARVLGRAGDPAARWDGVATQLGELLRELLSLPAPPPPEGALAALAGWTPERAEHMREAAERRFAVRLDAEAARAPSLAALAAAVAQARRTP